MATTGVKYPTLGDAYVSAPWEDNGWTSPENIYIDDGVNAYVTAATYDSPDQTTVLRATGFDFSSIPDGATIDGVIARINTWYAAGTVSIDLSQLLDTSKVRVGTNKYATPQALTTNDTTVLTVGSSTDLWGNALTAAWVKNANFGVGLGFLATGTNSDVFVDYVTLEIYYTITSVTVTPGTLALTITLYTPTVTVSDNVLVTPGTLNLTTTFYTPTVSISDNQVVTPGTLALVITLYTPTVTVGGSVTVTPGTLNLVLTYYTPTVSISDNKVVTPGTLSLVTTLYAPSVILGTIVTPGTLALILTTYAPSVVATDNQTVTPGTLALTLTLFTPVVTATANITVTPGTLALILTTYAPTITIGKLVTPGTLALIITFFAPTIFIPAVYKFINVEGVTLKVTPDTLRVTDGDYITYKEVLT